MKTQSLPEHPGVYHIVFPNKLGDYVGSSVNVRERWRSHLNDWGRGRHTPLMQAAWVANGNSAKGIQVQVTPRLPVVRLAPIEQHMLQNGTGSLNVKRYTSQSEHTNKRPGSFLAPLAPALAVKRQLLGGYDDKWVRRYNRMLRAIYLGRSRLDPLSFETIAKVLSRKGYKNPHKRNPYRSPYDIRQLFLNALLAGYFPRAVVTKHRTERQKRWMEATSVVVAKLKGTAPPDVSRELPKQSTRGSVSFHRTIPRLIRKRRGSYPPESDCFLPTPKSQMYLEDERRYHRERCRTPPNTLARSRVAVDYGGVALKCRMGCSSSDMYHAKRYRNQRSK